MGINHHRKHQFIIKAIHTAHLLLHSSFAAGGVGTGVLWMKMVLPERKVAGTLMQERGDIRHLEGVGQGTAESVAWGNWILYILKGIEETASETLDLVHGISKLMAEYKQKMRSELPKIYSHDLLNCLFFSPYTKAEHLEGHLSISRPTASKYLEALTERGLLKKSKVWRQNYYINTALVHLFANGEQALSSEELIRTVTDA